jgi:ABC-type branched-subunit amino acid transport system ATPase component
MPTSAPDERLSPPLLEVRGLTAGYGRVPAIFDVEVEVAAGFPQISGLLGRIARKLSGGERKMVAVGRALMLPPKVVLLDEPTANLSPMLASALLAEHVRRLADNGAAVLLVEQRAMAALRIADQAVVIVSGQVSLSPTQPNWPGVATSGSSSARAPNQSSPRNGRHLEVMEESWSHRRRPTSCS